MGNVTNQNVFMNFKFYLSMLTVTFYTQVADPTEETDMINYILERLL